MSYAALLALQVLINSFNSQGNPDWVEIKNDESEEVEITNYVIRDTASSDVYKWEKTFITSGSSCAIDGSNRLNNTGDAIYLLTTDGEHKDWVLY